MSENDTYTGDSERSFIGKCEVLFCPLPAEETAYSDAYSREIAVCRECYDERTGRSEVDENSKKYQFGQLAQRYLDTDTDRSDR